MNRMQFESRWYDIGYKTARKGIIDKVLEIIDKEVDGDLGKLSTQTARIRAAIMKLMEDGGNRMTKKEAIKEIEEVKQYVSGYDEALDIAIEALKQGAWIPVKFRPLTEEEEKEYPDYCYMADGQMPEDEEEILVTVKSSKGNLYVEKDVCYFDDGFSLDSGYDWQTDVIAWMPLPEAYIDRRMTHLNMTVEIDVCTDDEWGSSRAWIENEVMKKIAGAVSDLFKYPLSANAKLQELNINEEETDG